MPRLADAAVSMSRFIPHCADANLPRSIIAQQTVSSPALVAVRVRSVLSCTCPTSCIAPVNGSPPLTILRRHCSLQRMHGGQLFADATLGRMMLGQAMLHLLDTRRQVRLLGRC